MRIDERVRKRATELIERGYELAGWNIDVFPSGHDRQILHECEGWIASARNLIETVHPGPNSAYSRQASVLAVGLDKQVQVGGLLHVLRHLIDDVDAGVVARVVDAARAEVFDDFLDQASELLKRNRWQQAGVIAGVVFEDTVRRTCDRLSIPQKGVDLEQLIATLNKREVINDIKAKRARTAAGVRTKATHAQWGEFSGSDVDETIRLTRELIDTVLSA